MSVSSVPQSHNTLSSKEDINILVVSNSDEIFQVLEKNIKQLGHSLVRTNNDKRALEILDNEQVSHILIDVNLSKISSAEFVKLIRNHLGKQYIPIITLASTNDEELLSSCRDAGCDDFLFEPFTPMSLNARIISLKQISELKCLYKDAVNEQLVANRILCNALEGRNIQLEEIGLLSRSKSVFSGDLFLTARHNDGSLNVLLADFTGHGLSAAVGALPVADVFKAMTEKGFGLDRILESINKKLVTLLPTSMFMACSLLNISKDLQRVEIWNGGMPDIYIRTYGTDVIRQKIKSSHVPLGIDEELLNRFELEVVHLFPGDELILYTDGLTEAMNDDNCMFGYMNLTKCLQQNDHELSVFTNIVEAFDEFCGTVSPLDDVTLACIPCTLSLMNINKISIPKT